MPKKLVEVEYDHHWTGENLLTLMNDEEIPLYNLLELYFHFSLKETFNSVFLFCRTVKFKLTLERDTQLSCQIQGFLFNLNQFTRCH